MGSVSAAQSASDISARKRRSPNSFVSGERCSIAGANPSCALSLASGLITVLFFAHDLIRKPVPTFRDHALCLLSRAGQETEHLGAELDGARDLRLRHG